ncbi:MAG: thiolase family protein [Candidatus Zixiibacteriota bacterium]|nr:MAG: thiolase family protein [candidate division Zixibacteria bacterium]
MDGARTPFGEFCGILQDIVAIDLGAVAARGAIDRSGTRPEWIDHVIFGNALQTSSDAIYGARHVALKSGVPMAVPALTVNRIGGSGLQALISGAQMIQLNQAEVCLVGGMENMSQSPQVIRKTRAKAAMGYSYMEDSLWAALTDSYNGMMMVDTAENLAERFDISRQEQDEFAYRSYTLAVAARDSGRLNEEIVPVNVGGDSGNEKIALTDQSIRETTLERLAQLRPAIRKNGVVTVGNSSGLNDGAAALIIASREKAEELGLKPKARLKSYAFSGVDPDIMGIGAVPALKRALEQAQLNVSDIDIFEINESFASQYIACERELNLNRDRVNPNGGAIAIGNPLAASGARLVLTIVYEMVHRDANAGAVALAIGGGQGIAAVFERV